MSVEQFQSWEEAVSWLISQPDQQSLVRACYYDVPLDAAAERYRKSDEWSEIRQFLPSSLGKALDIGAGNGIASFALAKDGWHVSALEPDPSNLVGVGAIESLAKSHHLPVKVIQEFGETLPFQDGSFDVVFARQVLHHAQDLPKFCCEIHRVLKPGGTLVAVRDHVISSPNDLPKFFEIHPLHRLYGGENAFLLKDYVSAIKSSGLKIKKVLSPLETVINYAPYSRDKLRQIFQEKLSHIPGGSLVGQILQIEIIFTLLLTILSTLDRRPGRLYSFIAYK